MTLRQIERDQNTLCPANLDVNGCAFGAGICLHPVPHLSVGPKTRVSLGFSPTEAVFTRSWLLQLECDGVYLACEAVRRLVLWTDWRAKIAAHI